MIVRRLGITLFILSLTAFATAAEQKSAPAKPKRNVAAAESTTKPTVARPVENHLADEHSRYLVDHSTEAIAWYPWSPSALARAKSENKPIFVVVGYYSSHVGHVMDRESFDDPGIAAILNEHYVSILVDREEHPDVDATFMAVLQAAGSSGGWPASLILTPELAPIVATTYVPKETLGQILTVTANRWVGDRKELLATSAQLTSRVRTLIEQSTSRATATEGPTPAVLDTVYAQLKERYDATHGGFGTEQKFPQGTLLDFLLRYAQRTKSDHAREMALNTLREMARGTIHDQLGGGFHRFTIDPGWRVPHYEKMLYDQALLTIAYTEAYQMTGEPMFAGVARGAIEYVLGDDIDAGLHRKGSGFDSSQDADSLIPLGGGPKLVEGAFYTWEAQEMHAVLGAKMTDLVEGYYGVRSEGNVPSSLDPQGQLRGKNLLYVAEDPSTLRRNAGMSEQELDRAMAEARSTLYTVRAHRPQPFRDDKTLTGWNALMISALARTGAAFDERRYIAAAEEDARFLQTHLWDAKTKTLHRRWRDGKAGVDALPEDYAWLVQAMLDTYEGSFDIHFLQFAIELQQRQDALFWNGEAGRYVTPAATPLGSVVAEFDSPLPTANSVGAMNLVRLGELTDNGVWRARASTIFRTFAARFPDMPTMAAAFEASLVTPKQIVLAGNLHSEEGRALLRAVRAPFLRNRAILLADGAAGQTQLAKYLPFIAEMKPLEEKATETRAAHTIPTAFVCTHYVCEPPTADPARVAKELE